MRTQRWCISRLAGMVVALAAGAAWAHDPIFSPGPHVLFQGGVEIEAGLDAEKAGPERKDAAAARVTYGLTGDWSVGLGLPYVRKDTGIVSDGGVGDATLFTKYRFWRKDTLGAQESTAVLFRVKPDTAGDTSTPPPGTGSTDAEAALAYGYESRKWYRWASVRYRRNGRNDAGLRRGDRVFFDLVGGIRPRPTGYLEPDTVWLLELNGEYGRRADLDGMELADTGGTELFLSPGIFWTRRNFAVKAGVQIPVASNLNGNQEKSDYRGRLILELHL